MEKPRQTPVVIARGEQAELDEMWSFVGRKANQRWPWHVIDPRTGEVLAYVFGKRKDDVFESLNALLEPFGIRQFYTDNWGTYGRYLDEKNISLENATPKRSSAST